MTETRPSDAAVEALRRAIQEQFSDRAEGSIGSRMAGIVLDALPALLREDGPAGDALRERLGLRLDISRSWVSEDGRTTSTAPLSGTTPQETRSLYDTLRTTRRLP